MLARVRFSRRTVWLGSAALVVAAFIFALGPARRVLLARQVLAELSLPRSPASQSELREEELTLEGQLGTVRARLYRPRAAEAGAGLVLAHGIHRLGIDEPRLVALARALCRAKVAVVTPELSELREFRVTRGSVAAMDAAVQHLAERRELVSGGRVGLVGFSFAGGLALVAATENRTARHLRYVMSVGGHLNLDRVFHYLLTNQIETPTGIIPGRSHEYGLAVMLYGNLEALVEEAELPLTRQAFAAWLHQDQAEARRLASTLSGEGKRLFHLVEQGRWSELRPDLELIADRERPKLAGLSPQGRLAQIPIPVYVLHGAHDTVIPPTEASFAKLELTGRRHDVLVTPLLGHASLSQDGSMRERIDLLLFVAHLFP